MNYELNLIIIKQGEGSDSELNETGKLYAEEICNKLIEKGCKFNKVYSSSSNCAKQTIEPYLTKQKRNNVLYTKKLSEKDPSTLEKDLLEALTTGHYDPNPSINIEDINRMTFYDNNAEDNTLSGTLVTPNLETGELTTKNIYKRDYPIERIDQFIAKVVIDHLIYPEDPHFGYTNDPPCKIQSVLLVTHSDYFNIISSMFMSTEFSKVETTDNMISINFHHNWQIIIDGSFEYDSEYKLYSQLYSCARSIYLCNMHESMDDNEPNDDPYDLKSEIGRGGERYVYGDCYRNGRKLYFWD